jgi:hypothetical protein
VIANPRPSPTGFTRVGGRRLNVTFIVGDLRRRLGDPGGLDPDDMIEIDHATARLRPPTGPEPGSTDQIVDGLRIGHAIRRFEDVSFPGIGREPQCHRATVAHLDPIVKAEPPIGYEALRFVNATTPARAHPLSAISAATGFYHPGWIACPALAIDRSDLDTVTVCWWR